MSAHPPPPSSGRALDFLAGGGEAGARMRALDWTTTLLGPPGGWPPALASAVSICLNARFPICIYWGSDLTLLYNDAWSPIPGAKHPAALGRPAREVWAEIWHLIDPLFRQVVDTGEGTFRNDELLPMHRHGYTEECYFDYTFSPIRGDGGAVAGVFNAVTETTYRVITARRTKVLRDLAAATAQAKTAADACRLAVGSLSAAAHDLPFTLLYLTDAESGECVLAGSSGVAAGGPLSPAVVRLDDGTAPWPLAQAVRTGVTEVVKVTPERTGELTGGVWPEPLTQSLVVPVAATGRGGVAAVLVAGVSPRRALDDEYRSFFQLVSDQIATAIANARAYEEEKQRAEALAELDRAKTTFFSNVSHEFRTPLTLMLGPLEDVLGPDGDLTPDTRATLATVHRNGQRLIKLVNSLLDFSRLEAGRVQARFEPTDLSAFTAELASVFRAAIEKAGLRLVVDCPPLPEPVFVDRDMWEKVVLNLLSNAFKFTLEGEIRVRLRADGGRAVLAVEDTGTGIPEHELLSLFNRFHRVEGAKGRTHEGTGIGLALVQELTKLHGGSVTAASAYGRGTTLTVSVPFGRAHLPAERVATTNTTAPAAHGSSPFVEEALRWLPGDEPLAAPSGVAGDGERPDPGAARPRVVLADDNADMREYVGRLLASRYDVVPVADGRAALEAATTHRPDLVVTDVMMPLLDGFGLLEALRADPRTAAVPVIMLSARAGDEARVEGLEAGADDYLVKPFSARELMAKVGGTLALARTRQDAARREAELKAESLAILESIADGFVALDPDWRFTYVNAAAERITGMGRGELLGRTQWEVFPATLGTPNEDGYRKAMAERVPVRFENYYPPLDRTFEVEAYPVVGAGIGVYFRDVTDRKRVAAADAKFRALFEQATAGVVEADLTGRITLVNPRFCRLLGYEEAELLALTMQDVTHPDDVPESLDKFRALAAGGPDFVVEKRYVRKDGSVVWVSNSVTAVRGASGAPESLVAVTYDLTDRMRAEAARRESEERFRTFMDHSPAAAWVTDADGRIRYLSGTYLRMFKLPGGEPVGASVFDLFPADIAREYVENIRRVADTGRLVEAVEPGVRPDGSGGRFLVYKFPLPGEERLVGGVAIDISERLRAEEQLRDADRRKDEFLALLAHELRNPLAPLRNGLQVLRLSGANSDAAARARAMMDRQLGHMVRLIDDLLDVSRITRNKLTLRRERLRLSDVVAAAVETARPAVEAAGHELSILLPPQPLEVDGDLTRLAQVFSNLLTNSAKYTPPGGRIRLTAEARGAHAAVTVSDTGIGIPAESLASIFDMFSQVDRSIERNTGGLGIGLALVKGLVEMHGGTVEARSDGPGAGSAFTVLLPVGASSVGGPAAAPDGPAQSAGLGHRVLVVDDNRDSAESMAMMLTLLGGEVREAYDGIEAVAAAEDFRPDVILMDVGMPRMNGLEAARRIREHPWGRTMTIVALTGWGQDGDREKSRAAGCDGHLVKPVALEDLERLLRTLRTGLPG